MLGCHHASCEFFPRMFDHRQRWWRCSLLSLDESCACTGLGRLLEYSCSLRRFGQMWTPRRRARSWSAWPSSCWWLSRVCFSRWCCNCANVAAATPDLVQALESSLAWDELTHAHGSSVACCLSCRSASMFHNIEKIWKGCYLQGPMLFWTTSWCSLQHLDCLPSFVDDAPSLEWF